MSAIPESGQDAAEAKRLVLRESAVSGLALFASTGTLLCCALPIALVTLAGLGAMVASVVEAVPVLVTLALHKNWVFAGSAVMMAGAGWLLWRPGRTCPTDPRLAALCERSQIWNRRLLLVSAGLWAVGMFAAYAALPIRIALDA